MEWSEQVDRCIQALPPIHFTSAALSNLFHLIDLTSLNDDDTETSIAALCQQAESAIGHTAAVCVYPQFVRLVAAQFYGKPIKTATVVNFPHGDTSLDTVLIEITRAIEDGANEIDVVFPYTRYLMNEKSYAQDFVASCKAACGKQIPLKVILETGALIDPAIIADAAYDALTYGADFIKTSTGKIKQGASLSAAATMLLVIKQFGKAEKGIKISGGVRTPEDALPYLNLAIQTMGENWLTPNHFRIGSSRLAEEILKLVNKV